MIKVCDAIMGSGKSQSAIAHMNEHKDQKFVYITPYLDEAERIKNACPELRFIEPSNKIPEYGFRKINHTASLLEEGRNITTTHTAFKFYNENMIGSIQKHGYTLIIDEALDILRDTIYNKDDIDMLLKAGYIVKDGDSYKGTDLPYEGDRMRELYHSLKCNNLVEVAKKAGKYNYYYWATPFDVLKSFKQVFILTYMFECQEMKYYLDLHNIPYEYIGVARDENGFRFSDTMEYIPEYTKTLSQKIHIFDNDKLNSVGDKKCSLSASWFDKKNNDKKEILRKHLYNYIRNYTNARSEDVMWTTYSGNVNFLRGKGYTKQHTPFNLRAKNDYRDKTVLAYCVNVFPNPNKVNYFFKYGIEYDADGYALSTMVQWIWRSAIRDGQEIWIYIPSKRMRELLENWIAAVERGDIYEM